MPKKKHAEHVNLERWLVSYADFITLLFAFFVVMYAISQVDLAKFKKAAESMHEAFGGAPGGAFNLHGSVGGSSVLPFDPPRPPKGRIQDLPAGKQNTMADPDPELQETRDLLEESMSLEAGVADPSNTLTMQYDSRGLVVRLAVKGIFAPGSAEVPADLRPLMDRIGRVVEKTKRLVRIEGHADALEGDRKSGFDNDWELAAARASWVAKYWLQRFKIDPKRIGVASYSHYRPVSDNTSEAGRARNRRVEIIFLNDKFESP